MIRHYLLLTLIVLSTFLHAQNKVLTLEDATLGYWKGLYPESLQSLQWLTDYNTLVYIKDNELIYFDAEEPKPNAIYKWHDLQKVYPQLNRFPTIKSISTSQLILNHAGINTIDIKTKQKVSISEAENSSNHDYSDEAKAVAYTVDNNLYITNPEEVPVEVTQFKDKNIVAGQALARSEYGISKGTFWSPKGNYLAFYQKDESNVQEYPLIDITTYPATAKPIKYPMAGQGSEIPSVGIFNMKKKQTIYLNIDAKDNHYVTNLSWTPDEKYLLIAEINRSTTAYNLNLYNVETGKKIRTILTETNEKWVEPEHEAVFVPNSNSEFIWMSEKDGFMNLYLSDISGQAKIQITDFDWVVKDILGFDKGSKNVFISGTGPDARETHTYKVNLNTKKVTKLTSEAGTHKSELSYDGKYLIDVYSSLDIPGITQIINTETVETRIIQQSKDPLKEYSLGKQEFIDLKTNDGTILHGLITKPANFDPKKKYPVLIYVYGGPHAQMVTNSFLGGASMWLPAFASLNDYIVFTLDNRGSSNRGFKFESGIHRKLGTIEIEDQLTGVKYLKALSYVDNNRLAIHGWSFGGFMSTSLMVKYPTIFTTAVAGGPVIDWKYYEVMYGERYMDTPQENPIGYKEANASKNIQDLLGNLLVISGSVDPVVVPQHSMQLLKAAVDKNIPIDFFTYPMHEHNVRGINRVHLIEKIADYIVEHNK